VIYVRKINSLYHVTPNAYRVRARVCVCVCVCTWTTKSPM